MNHHRLNVSASPHVRASASTRTIMRDVAFALLPASFFGVWHFGLNALLLIVTCVACAVLTEYAYEKCMKKKVTVGDFSAVVTGLILALNLPPNAPIWLGAIGSVFAILVVKQLFGGLGQNFMNPALAARCFLLISFTSRMTDFSVDGVSGATPLAALKAGEPMDLLAGYIGTEAGTIGETSVLFLSIGAAYLVARKVISLRIPLIYIGTVVVFAAIFGGHGLDANYLLGQVLGGGLFFGAFFMATDYVTTPITPGGQVLFALAIGILTGIFRCLGASAEGVSYAILLGNLLTPLIEKVTIPAPFGVEKGGKAR